MSNYPHITIAKTFAKHPMLPKLWDAYAKEFNTLADTLEKHGIDMELFTNVENALKQVYILRTNIAYVVGCTGNEGKI